MCLYVRPQTIIFVGSGDRATFACVDNVDNRRSFAFALSQRWNVGCINECEMSQNSSLIMSTKRLALVHLTVQDGKRNNGELCKISDQCQLACARALLTLCISTIIYFTRVIHIQSFVLIMKTKFICCWLVSSGAIAILFEARLRRSRLFYY